MSLVEATVQDVGVVRLECKNNMIPINTSFLASVFAHDQPRLNQSGKATPKHNLVYAIRTVPT